MSWSANLADLADAAVDPAAFGEPALYRVGGTGDPLAVSVIDDPTAQAVGKGGIVEIRHELHVRRSDIAAPARGDTVEVGGEAFVVQGREPRGALWALTVRKGG